MKAENPIGTRSSIATKLLIIVFSVYLLVAVSLTIGQMVMEYRYQKSSVEHDLKAIQQTYEKGLAIDIWQLDDESLSSIIEGMLKLPVVVGVRVRNARGVEVAVGGITHQHGVRVGKAEQHINLLGLGKEVTALYDEHHRDSNNVFTHEFRLSYVHEGKTDQLGRVTLYSNSSVVFKRVKMGFLLIVLNAILKTVALWFIFLYFSKKLLRKPLLSLASAVENVSLDNLDSVKVDVGTSGLNELKVIEDSFNSMIGNLRNSVMERERTTVALQTLHAKHEKMIANIGDVIVIIDSDGINRFKSANVGKQFGWSPEELIGKPLLDTVHPYDLEAVQAFIDSLMETPNSINTIECRYRSKDGSYKWIEFTGINLLHDPDIQGILGNYHDITERKQAEAAATLLANAKSKFISVVSHELRSPLATIKEATSLVREEVLGPLNNEQKDMLEVAKININRLGRLVSNVLTYQKIDAGKMLYDFVDNDVNEIMQEVYRNSILAYSDRKNDLVMNLAPKPPLIRFDKDKIMQVLLNLISNAMKYSESGLIVIETRLNTREMVIRVRDSGQGIYPEELEKIFLPFSHGRERKTGGTGLGLAISREIVVAHNGRIWAESEKGKGSTFYFTLPL
jgi:two-component system, sensor histidine kinase and response regulator